MNIIDATITKIESIDNLAVVSFSAYNQNLKMVSLGLDKQLTTNSKIELGVKASSISIAKDFSGTLSLSNQLECTIDSINHGLLLSNIKLLFGDIILESVIVKESALEMNLNTKDRVLALIKSSELSIVGV